MNPEISASLEDYLETILLLGGDQSPVRVRDIVCRQGVKAPSVIEAVGHLVAKDLAVKELSGGVRLTSQGRKMARKIYARHCTLKRFFFEILHLSAQEAEDSACRVEHHLSQKTVNRLFSLLRYWEHTGAKAPSWLKPRSFNKAPRKILGLSPSGKDVKRESRL